MMTKEQYCQAIINASMKEYNVGSPTKLIPFIYSSTKLGIALQQLGYISDMRYPVENSYISNRGGVVEIFVDDPYVGDESVHILTVRDLISLLPEKLNDEKSETDQMFDNFKQNIPLK